MAVTGTVRTIVDGQWEDPGVTHGGFRFFDAGTSVAPRHDRRAHAAAHLDAARATRRASRCTARGSSPRRTGSSSPRASYSPRPAYQPIAGEVILVNTPGVTTADLSTFTTSTGGAPLYPFEPDATYEPAAPAARAGS